MAFLKKHWGTIAGIAGPLLAFELPSLRAYGQSHPHTMLGVIIAALVGLYNSSAPKDKVSAQNGKVQ